MMIFGDVFGILILYENCTLVNISIRK